MTEPDPSTLRAARAGDRAALADLCRQWWPVMRRWALLELGDPVSAEDAAQEALVRLMRFLATWRDDRPFAPWLHAIVRNAARDVVARRGEVLEPVGEEASEPRTEDLDLRRTASVAIAAFERLSPRQRQVVDLCDRGGHTPAEAAELLEIAPGTARALLHQGRQALRAAILGVAGPEVLELLRENRS